MRRIPKNIRRARILTLALCSGAAGCSEYVVTDGTGPLSPAPAPGPTLAEPPSSPRPPVADAGPDLQVAPLEAVPLDATRSYDPDGLDIVAVRWALVERPEGSTARVSDPERAKPTLPVDLAGTYRLTLDVQNRPGLWDPTPDELVIEAVPDDALYVQLSWEGENDLDLHLLDGGAPLFGPGDCNFCNLTPDWGGPGPRDDPSLDADAVFGFGPEAISIEAPANGAYTVAVHYYGEQGLSECLGPCERALATVLVYVDGELAGKFARIVRSRGHVWHVATVQFPEGVVSEIDEIGYTNRSFCW